ncbi:DUF397 domain-containing protein [Streptomyces sp. NPDC048523]|uniref:DUF397 domain-containing protein n=1 Tax=unclassified Streptomyces TaxID=2593676 RepID=UPI00332CA878
MNRPDLVWKKSARSGPSNCVEVAISDAVFVRDTKWRGGLHIECSRSAWGVFIRNLALRREGSSV